MRELIVSDITEMGSGLCVIGIELATGDLFRSVRPIPPLGFAWDRAFPHKRGSQVRFTSRPTSVCPPHCEDQNTNGLQASGTCPSEVELVGMLQRAEVSTELEGLFGCELHVDTKGGNAWVDSSQASSSICGCLYTNLRFLVFQDPNRITLRARLVLVSGETLNSLPVVDREWRRFIDEVTERRAQSGGYFDLERYLNRFIRRKLLQALHGFARIGLARADNGHKCWLMLDSLFPQPDASWLDVL
jgi:hypothetical protein